jgi:hypothetical protein
MFSIDAPTKTAFRIPKSLRVTPAIESEIADQELDLSERLVRNTVADYAL